MEMMPGVKVLVIGVLFSSVLCSTCSPRSLCSDDIKANAVSLDSKNTATLFIRDRGPTTSFATSVRLRTRWLGFIPRQKVIFVAKNLPRIKLVWNGGGNLLIQCSQCRRITAYAEMLIYREERSWLGVKISYCFSR
jgi:hypothetical protein